MRINRKAKPKTITVTKDGPYLVSNSGAACHREDRNECRGRVDNVGAGRRASASEAFKLCRCGESRYKAVLRRDPCQDRFRRDRNGQPQPFMRQAEVLDGPAVQLADAEVLCAFAGRIVIACTKQSA